MKLELVGYRVIYGLLRREWDPRLLEAALERVG